MNNEIQAAANTVHGLTGLEAVNMNPFSCRSLDPTSSFLHNSRKQSPSLAFK